MADKKITKKSVVPEKEAECCPKGKILKKHLLFLAVLVILIAVLGYFFKDKIIAATVNGKPILIGFVPNTEKIKKVIKKFI